MAHLRTFAIAAAFGLLAYGVVRVLVYASNRFGVLQWIAS
jgi:hypothetical protein